MDGLLGAQKNVGYSSIVCAAIRLHDQCIAIGEAAGATAAVALRKEIQPRDLPFDRNLLEEVRHCLCGKNAKSTPLQLWPFRDLPATHPAFVAINRLATRGMLPQKPTDVDFKPDSPTTPEWRTAIVEASRKNIAVEKLPEVSNAEMTRGAFCRFWWNAVRDLPLTPFRRLRLNDADNDGIKDRDDPIPFTPAGTVIWKVERRPVTPLSADQDGLPDQVKILASMSTRQFNFCGQSTKPNENYERDNGLPFVTKRGFGWVQDISSNNRHRSVYPETIRDTFLFTRDFAKWECRIPNGRWLITVCNGDSGHEQTGHQVSFEGKVAVKNVPTAAGHFVETTVTVVVTDGRLTMELGPQLAGSNTCVNWLRLISLDND
jgi:hypothetical protein